MDAPTDLHISTLVADYVILGAGAVGMAFADTLVGESRASVIVVDRRAQPGGHWNDAYPFVRLHSPSATYGVDSLPLGNGHIDAIGLNQGLAELAGGAEICAYFDRVMREQLLPSGRVTWLPLHDVQDGVATSLLDGRRVRLQARRRWVDATVADTQVPATHGPSFAVVPGVRCVTPSELARQPRPAAGYVIVGGGKTAMDTALWLLGQGVAPESITWIRPRDAWLLNRAHVQPLAAFAKHTLAGLAGEMEAACGAADIPELFARLEAGGQLLRIDPEVTPRMFRCAIVSEPELAQLRRIRQVVRLGRVRTIEPERIVLEGGIVPTSRAHVHVHCTSAGLPRGPAQPMFQPGRIVPQYVRRCSPSFSAALVAYLEIALDSDEEKNALCAPVPPPAVPTDWLRDHLLGARNQQRWLQHPGVTAWLRRSRLEAYGRLFTEPALQDDAEFTSLQERMRKARPAALRRMAELLAIPQERPSGQEELMA